MKCQLCHQSAAGLMVLRVYTSKGIQVCGECYQAVESCRHKPYSKVMERLAMAELLYASWLDSMRRDVLPRFPWLRMAGTVGSNVHPFLMQPQQPN